MKKLVVCLCTGMMIAGLAACGGNDKNDGQSSSAVGSSAVGNSAATNSTAENPTTESTGAATTESSSAEGSVGHNYEEGWTEEMEGVKAAIVEELGDNYFPNAPLFPNMLEEMFGITSDMYDDYFAELPMISANVDTLVIVKAKDDRVKEVEDALNAYHDAKVNDTLQYPQNVGKVQASRVERIGNYVCFVELGGDVSDLLDSGDEVVITHCQEINELVIEIISQNVQHE